MLTLPQNVKKFLWDVNTDNLTKFDSAFIIERILEYGDWNELEWLIKNFKKEEITNVLKNSKRISSKTGNFYALYFDIPKKEILCINKPFIRKQDRF